MDCDILLKGEFNQELHNFGKMLTNNPIDRRGGFGGIDFVSNDQLLAIVETKVHRKLPSSVENHISQMHEFGSRGEDFRRKAIQIRNDYFDARLVLPRWHRDASDHKGFRLLSALYGIGVDFINPIQNPPSGNLPESFWPERSDIFDILKIEYGKTWHRTPTGVYKSKRVLLVMDFVKCML